MATVFVAIFASITHQGQAESRHNEGALLAQADKQGSLSCVLPALCMRRRCRNDASTRQNKAPALQTADDGSMHLSSLTSQTTAVTPPSLTTALILSKFEQFK